MNESSSLKKLCRAYLAEEPDPALRAQINSLLLKTYPEQNPAGQDSKKALAELADRMKSPLFGTAGLRGPMEAGYNRMNLVSIYRFAYALAHSLEHSSNIIIPKTKITAKAKIVIGFDARLNSPEFAHEITRVLADFACEVYMFDQCVPTPILAYATKYLGADCGVMITASHNPGCDNGIKVYDQTSSQISKAWTEAIEQAMSKAPPREIHINQAYRSLVKQVDRQVLNAYFAEISTHSLFAKTELDLGIKLVYTPLHGVGRDYFIRALTEANFDHVYIVNEQAEPDGQFPSVDFPNPEEDHALDLAHQQAIKLGIEIVIANDPDADRVQLSCVDESGSFKKLSGNEMGVILGYFTMLKAQKDGLKPLVASSIVSSRMLKSMAAELGVAYVDSLTGFGNISRAAMKASKTSQQDWVFAYEEAIGFLVGQTILDKDGIGSGLRLVEILSYLAQQKKSVGSFLDELYLKFGLFINHQWYWRLNGVSWQEQMAQIMSRFRSLDIRGVSSLLSTAGHAADLSHGDISNCAGWQTYDLASSKSRSGYQDLNSDVLIFELEKKLRLIIRPSGTEPKIKFYLEHQEQVGDLLVLNSEKSRLRNLCVSQQEKITQFLGTN